MGVKPEQPGRQESIKMKIPLILGVLSTLGLCQSSSLTETTQAPISKADPQKQTEADKIQAAWSDWRHTPSEAELKTAAQLAQESYLSSVKNLDISDKNISEIPSDQLAKLASIVTDRVGINNMTPSTQLGPILASVKSTQLVLGNMSLSEENTRALVTAMRTRVQAVGLWSGVTLDPELLAAYDGQGSCTKLVLYSDTMTRTRLRRWAGEKEWDVTWDSDYSLRVERQ